MAEKTPSKYTEGDAAILAASAAVEDEGAAIVWTPLAYGHVHGIHE